MNRKNGIRSNPSRKVFQELKVLLFLVSLLLASVFPAGRVRGEALWSEDYYRAMDMSEQMSDAERDSLDKMCLSFVAEKQVDLALLAVPPDRHEETSYQELAEAFYDTCGFGYGEGRDCLILVCDAETGESQYCFFGAAEEKLGIPEDYYRFAEGSAAGFLKEYGVYGVLYSGARLAATYEPQKGNGAGAAAGTETAAETAASTETKETITEITTETTTEAAGTTASGTETAAGTAASSALNAVNERVGEGSSMPAWYLKEPEKFVPYHDETAPRVVDDADMFTDAEESAMKERISELKEELGKDIVIYTNMSSCGLEHEIMAADFYDFNGYGVGDDYEGICLYVCMDPDNRGWFAACSGPDTMGLYTEEIANDIDDELYEHMVDGDYGPGVIEWIENIGTMFRKGDPFAPDWLPDRGEAPPERTHRPDAPRIDDTAELLSDAERESLLADAKAITERYGIDVVIHTAKRPGGLSREEYAEKYYAYNGYGLGDNYDGILLTVFKRPGYTATASMYASGKGAEKLSAVNEERIMGYVTDKLSDRSPSGAMKAFLTHVDHMERTGRVARSFFYWIWITVTGIIGGGITGIVSLSRAMTRMKVPALKVNADQYLLRDSLRVGNISDQSVGTHTTKRYIPPPTRSSGGSSSSGRSTYRSSYSGSSGRSHSGSGRRF